MLACLVLICFVCLKLGDCCGGRLADWTNKVEVVMAVREEKKGRSRVGCGKESRPKIWVSRSAEKTALVWRRSTMCWSCHCGRDVARRWRYGSAPEVSRDAIMMRLGQESGSGGEKEGRQTGWQEVTGTGEH